jgi:hypothetical protein
MFKGMTMVAVAAAILGPILGQPTAATAAPQGMSPVAGQVSPQAVEEVDTAVAGTPPAFSANECTNNNVTKVCFEPHGDKVWVLDLASDGNAASGLWENYLWNGGAWQLYRQGMCMNKLSYGHWGVCNKDFYEDSTNPNAYGSKGSGLRIYACALCDPAWIRNNA